MEIEVKGHSGCKIEIINDGKNLHLRKSSVDKKYSDRLRNQAEKQKNAKIYKLQHIRIPEIYSIEQNDESLIINMEYVYSKNFIEYFEDAGFVQVDYFIKALKLFIDYEIENSEMLEVSKNIITKKFKDVKKNIRERNLFYNRFHDDLENIIAKCEIIFRELDDKIMMPIGICHGDLTFSNILFNGNNYYLIDFLDSFIESPLLDIVKIRQDSCFLWSQLMYHQDFDRVRLVMICKNIDNQIDHYYQKFDWYRKYYKSFQIMNFLRIIQYGKDKNVVAWINNVLNGLLK